ncbi:MAG TPA: TRAP transporter small permease [Casimicrobiaceae bacterium]
MTRAPIAGGNAVRTPMHRLTAAYYRLLNGLLGVSVATLLVPVTLQIVARFTGLIPHWIWTEEMARFLFIWMVMLGAMIGVRDGTHFEVDVWPELGPRANALLRLVSYAFILVFALVFVWYGVRFVQFGWDQTSELAEMPMTYIFVAWPLTGLTWLLFGCVRMAADLRILRGLPAAAGAPPPHAPARAPTGTT